LTDVNEPLIATKQIVFREVNERIAEITAEQGESASQFVCECGGPDCVSTLQLSLGDYSGVRASGDFFIAASGHCVEGVDRLVESRDGYEVLAQL
jgi:hypothetical protein